MSDWSSFPKQKHITDQWRKFLAEVGGYAGEAAPMVGSIKKKVEIGEQPDQLTPEEGALVVRAVGAIEKVSTNQEMAKVATGEIMNRLSTSNLEVYNLIYDTVSKSKVDLISDAIAQGMAAADPASIAEQLEIVQVKRASPTATMLVNIGGATSPKTFFTFESGIAEAITGEGAKGLLRDIDITLNKIFGFVKLDYQRYIVAMAIKLYWEIILSKNPFGLDENGQYNALTIAKYQTDWLNKNVNIEAINQQRVQNQNDLKKMLPALPGAQL